MNNKLVKAIALLSIFVGVMVIVGWLLDITVLTSILPQWIRMKFATALCFIFSGIILLVLSTSKTTHKELRRASLMIFSMLNVLIMGTLFFGSVFGFQTGMEDLSFVDIHETATPIFQGRPSVATMFCFLLIAVVAFMSEFGKSSRQKFAIAGSIICLIGLLGVLGYVLKMPSLYYEIPGFSNAIAVHTTALFALLGFGLIKLATGKRIS